MFNKKTFSFLLVISLLILGLAACNKANDTTKSSNNTEDSATSGENSDKKDNEDSKPSSDKKIAVLYYQYSDTYISTVRKEVNKLLKVTMSLNMMDKMTKLNKMTKLILLFKRA